jgi:hypothetical protein
MVALEVVVIRLLLVLRKEIMELLEHLIIQDLL